MKLASRFVAIAVVFTTLACGASDPSEDSVPSLSDRSPLVLISLDGFRWDYPDLTDTPALDRIMTAGVRAEGMIPVFPSKTFPSHYSIVTGLHPGHHGIVSNNIRDPRWPEPFALRFRDEVRNSRWWGGEPIWVTANRAGLRTASFFWPGSEAPIQGVQPDYWMPFDDSVPAETRVDTVLEWLALPEAERPTFVTMYFEETDSAGHEYGPGSWESLEAIRAADIVIGRLLDGLDAQGTLESTNIVVVSDHGMATHTSDQMIALEDYVELWPHEVFEVGALLQIFPDEGREGMIYDALHDAHPNLRIFRPSEAPAEFHLYDNPRLGPILGTPDPGWEVRPRGATRPGDWLAGHHGADPSHEDMHGVFIAAGPAFVSDATVARLPGVDIYNILAHALRVDPAPNDGNPARLDGIVRR
ncbi:MAG: sulfatase-like hydrolase/transferase [Acidobacteria bacterium]|nr:sulfatase-like hydrolase/transferase [Acidobacteriota bacterium]